MHETCYFLFCVNFDSVISRTVGLNESLRALLLKKALAELVQTAAAVLLK